MAAIALPFVDGETVGRDGSPALVGVVVSNVDRDPNGGTAIGRGWGIGNRCLPGCRSRLLLRGDLNGLIPVPVRRSEGKGGLVFSDPRVSSRIDSYRDDDIAAGLRSQPYVVGVCGISFSNVERGG